MTNTPPSAELSAEEAIPLLVEQHGDKLFALGLRFCGDRTDAEDMVQETFLQAWKSWDSFKGESSPSTWLYTIASRACQRMHRKRVGEPDHLVSLDAPRGEDDAPLAEGLPMEAGLMGVVPADDDPLAATIRSESREAVQAAIADLPLDFRMPLVLKEIVGLAVRDIARIMDTPEATVKTRLHRARLRLRDALAVGLPRREVPRTAFSEQVCRDLLHAKQETLDRGEPFAFPGEIVCERCAEYFATLDLAGDVCREITLGELPDALRAELLRPAV